MNWTLIGSSAAAGIVGAALGWLLNNRFGATSLDAMRKRADEMNRAARRAAEKTNRAAVLESKQFILKQRDKFDRDLRSRKGRLAKRDRDLRDRQQALADRETDEGIEGVHLPVGHE